MYPCPYTCLIGYSHPDKIRLILYIFMTIVFLAKIKTDCICKYTSIPKNIAGNSTAYNFKSEENVLVSNAIVITLDSWHKVKNYGWILRNYITK